MYVAFKWGNQERMKIIPAGKGVRGAATAQEFQVGGHCWHAACWRLVLAHAVQGPFPWHTEQRVIAAWGVVWFGRCRGINPQPELLFLSACAMCF